MPRAQAADNVTELLGIFDNSFAIYGTALGSLRERGVIEHDPDTDIGIFNEHLSWQSLNEAIRRGYEVLAIFGMRYYGLEIALKKDDIKTDIMVFYKDKENPVKRFNCLWKNGGRNGMADVIVHEYDETMLQPVIGELNGNRIKTLGEEYIKHVYGEDWRTPVKKWDWQNDHKCKKTG